MASTDLSTDSFRV